MNNRNENKNENNIMIIQSMAFDDVECDLEYPQFAPSFDQPYQNWY